MHIWCNRCSDKIMGRMGEHYEREHLLSWLASEQRWIELEDAHHMSARKRWSQERARPDYRPSGRRAEDQYQGTFKDMIVQAMIRKCMDPHICALCGKRSGNRFTIDHTK